MIITRDFSKEFKFTASRSGGAGGQNVNKVSSKVELRFHVDSSELLTDDEKQLLKDKAAASINSEGWLQIVCQEDRSQLKNKETCVKKFYNLLLKSFRRVKPRKDTKPTFASVKKRLVSKKKEGEKKASRRKFTDE